MNFSAGVLLFKSGNQGLGHDHIAQPGWADDQNAFLGRNAHASVSYWAEGTMESHERCWGERPRTQSKYRDCS
jgi:hypothetical protein